MPRMPRSCAPAPGTVPHPDCSPLTIPAMAKPLVVTPEAEDFPRWYRGGTRPADRSVPVRRLVAEDGSVPGSEDAPGTLAIVARAR